MEVAAGAVEEGADRLSGLAAAIALQSLGPHLAPEYGLLGH